MANSNGLETRLLSSLTKVFADEEIKERKWDKGSMLCNEVYSFQMAYCWKQSMIKQVGVRVVSELSPWVTIRKVELVPVEMPCYADHDDNLLRTTPGLYPDLLQPFNEDELTLLPNQWRSLWLTIDPKTQANGGIYPIEVIFENNQGDMLASETYILTIIESKLPKQSLIHTEWFHTDCLATWYNVEVFSEEHWQVIEQYMKTAVQHGINMILTPIFTPPLDTQVGGERLTVQLVDVEKIGNKYRFGFDKLSRWIELCRSNGVEYLEFSHLFTQWGAKHAPKIMAVENGEMKRIFGWDTEAMGEDYGCFLDEFLFSLVTFIKERGLEKCCYFHISDEPNLDHLESYENASIIINKHLNGFPVLDALSDYEFYEKGLVKIPIPATIHIDAFLEHNIPDLWTYYCGFFYKKVSNRFISIPSARNRVFGMQLYKFNILGFLHWGYNFWYSQYSICPIDPFRVTDSGFFVPAGDAFLVYPGDGGPLESIRLEVFYEALQDMRAFKLLEEMVGREDVLKMIEEGLETPITFSEYPSDAEWLLQKREDINRRISEYNRDNKTKPSYKKLIK